MVVWGSVLVRCLVVIVLVVGGVFGKVSCCFGGCVLAVCCNAVGRVVSGISDSLGVLGKFLWARSACSRGSFCRYQIVTKMSVESRIFQHPLPFSEGANEVSDRTRSASPPPLVVGSFARTNRPKAVGSRLPPFGR